MGGNLLITLGALSLVGLLVLTTNNNIMNNNVTVAESEIVITGISLAQSLIDEIKTKAFDQVEITGTIDSPSDLSSTLGPEAGEKVATPDTSSSQAYSSLSAYNDVDDYNGYSRTVDTDIAENFSLTCTVQYVQVSNPDILSGTRTYSKLITVTVTSPFFTTLPSVQMRSAITY
ncbi:MAG: hypothetical protein QY331_14845 [Melioribacteraceae bacterium]|nr:hypothetical protein [Melioribacteraceae bacterium]WKZ69237.1 MAG: hypothetical protein QY331_14845 [Melioribacteraceae bacterium]